MRRRKRPARCMTLLVAAVMVLSCGSADRVRIAVLTDLPGLAYQYNSTNERTGFDVSMYRWLAVNTTPRFDYDEFDITIMDREKALGNDRDVVLGAYSITDYRRTLVGFAGPYLVTQQGVMVLRDGPLASITRADQLAYRTACAQVGSTSADELRRLAGGRVSVREHEGTENCVQALVRGEVDLVSTDQLILRGYARQDGRLVVPEQVVFGTYENYGIGLPLGDRAACVEWTERLRAFLTSPAWDQFYEESFGEPPRPGAKPAPADLADCPD